jgi:hypothetical protein
VCVAARQAVLLSVQSPAPESVFAVVFAVVTLGAVALTLNVVLLARQRQCRKSARESLSATRATC